MLPVWRAPRALAQRAQRRRVAMSRLERQPAAADTTGTRTRHRASLALLTLKRTGGKTLKRSACACCARAALRSRSSLHTDACGPPKKVLEVEDEDTSEVPFWTNAQEHLLPPGNRKKSPVFKFFRCALLQRLRPCARRAAGPYLRLQRARAYA